MQIALYARVSTERQERQQTVDSQLAALRCWAAELGHDVLPLYVFVDEGYSGSRLDRPALDRLRDAAREGEVDAVAVLTPDRLARKYVHQMLLLDELRRAGCDVLFVQRPISDDPNDQLLLQIQGAVAEYERALLGERFRRGKLQKARSGQYVGGRPPYGYRYVPRAEAAPGHLVIDEAEADLVRMLYPWLIDEEMTIRQILKRLNDGPWWPRSGRTVWSASVVHHILADPIYGGTAYSNRYRYVPPKRPRAMRGPRASDASCRQLKPREEWIPVPVPAIVDQVTRDHAEAQLARNAALSFRNNTKYSYLLRCLLTCASCGLAMFGTTYRANATRGREHRYYKCHGKDPILSARETICQRRPVRAEELETAVWSHVVQLLNDPARLIAQFHSAATTATMGDARERADDERLAARISRVGREDARLLDAYQADVISLDELGQRRKLLAAQRAVLVEQRDQQARLRREGARAQEVLTDLTAFCDRIRSRLHAITFAEKQTILQLLVERVVVGDDTLEIRHVIPLGNTPVPGGDRPGPDPRLRSDGVHAAPLPGCADEDLGDGLLQPAVGVRDDQLHPAQAAADQSLQELSPQHQVLAHPDVDAENLAHPVGAQRVRADDRH